MNTKPYRNTFLSHVEIYVSDYAKTIRFYDRMFHLAGRDWFAKKAIQHFLTEQ